jgi:hypothetical protein
MTLIEGSTLGRLLPGALVSLFPNNVPTEAFGTGAFSSNSAENEPGVGRNSSAAPSGVRHIGTLKTSVL